MWCSTCQQDVPGVAHATSERIVCSRCQRPLQTKSTVHAARICDEGIALDETAAALAVAAPPLRGDDWSARQRHLGRELRRPTVAAAPPTIRVPHGRRRFDPPQNLVEQLQQITTPSVAGISAQPTATALLRSRRAEASQIVAWLVVVVGAFSLAAGIGLIGWSLAAKQMMYWNSALGLTLGGQGTLILGLVLVVSRLWRSSRHAANKLQDVHLRLGQLQQTADVLTSMRSGGAPAFYAELARGASPQVLLANLKGQLDQLATRVGSGW
ncbi:MAG: hypothetical protein WD738_06085 [Pirellulales bacterium]